MNAGDPVLQQIPDLPRDLPQRLIETVMSSEQPLHTDYRRTRRTCRTRRTRLHAERLSQLCKGVVLHGASVNPNVRQAFGPADLLVVDCPHYHHDADSLCARVRACCAGADVGTCRADARGLVGRSPGDDAREGGGAV